MVTLGGHAWLLGGCTWLLGGGMRGCSRGACMVAPRGMCGCSGGMRGCSGGACVVVPGGMHGFLGGVHGFSGGRVWFFQGGGMRGFFDEIRSMRGGTHPTGMHSCCTFYLCFLYNYPDIFIP